MFITGISERDFDQLARLRPQLAPAQPLISPTQRKAAAALSIGGSVGARKTSAEPPQIKTLPTISTLQLPPDLQRLLDSIQQIIREKGDPTPDIGDAILSRLAPEPAEFFTDGIGNHFSLSITRMPAAFWDGIKTPSLQATLRLIACCPKLSWIEKQLAVIAAISLAYGEGVYNPDAHLRPKGWRPGMRIPSTASGMFGLTDAGYAEGIRIANDPKAEGYIIPRWRAHIVRDLGKVLRSRGLQPAAKDRLTPSLDLNYPVAAAALIADNTRFLLRHVTWENGMWTASSPQSAVGRSANKQLVQSGRLRNSFYGGWAWLMMLVHTKSRYSVFRNQVIPHPERAGKDDLIAEVMGASPALFTVVVRAILSPLTELMNRVATLPSGKTDPKALLDRLVGDPTLDDDPAKLVTLWNSAVHSAYGIHDTPIALGTAQIIPRTGAWGPRQVKKGSKFHRGLDIRARSPLYVFAPADGVVSNVDYGGGWGRHLDLNHVQLGLQTKYAHLSKVLVPVGTSVKKGMIIAITGQTQSPGQPHLHWETWLSRSRSRVDPLGTQLKGDWKHLVNSK